MLSHPNFSWSFYYWLLLLVTMADKAKLDAIVESYLFCPFYFMSLNYKGLQGLVRPTPMYDRAFNYCGHLINNRTVQFYDLCKACDIINDRLVS